jgi:Protein of unknown function (DUF3253)
MTEQEQDDSRRDAVAAAILAQLHAAGPGASLSPDDIARGFAESRRKKSDPPDLWRRYLTAVRQQALHLARDGKIVILRRGEPQDPQAPIKGLIRLALPAD